MHCPLIVKAGVAWDLWLHVLPHIGVVATCVSWRSRLGLFAATCGFCFSSETFAVPLSSHYGDNLIGL